MRTVSILRVVLCATSVLCAQTARVPTVTLSAKKVELPISHPSQIVDKTKCDSAGNLYARIRPGDGSKVATLPLQQITPTGNLTARLSLPPVTEAVGSIQGIFVSDAGIVYEAFRTIAGIYVIGLSRDGAEKSSTKLEVDPQLVDPWQLAVFNSGGYLLSGLGGEGHRRPYTAVFDKDGKLVKSIYEPEDDEARRRAESGDSDYIRSSAGNRFVGFGDVTLGNDGNAYLLRGTSPALVYVISSAGNVVRKLRLDAEAPNYAARDINSFGGRLAVEFIGPDDFLQVAIADLQGKEIARYVLDRHSPDWPDLVCYNSEGFTFVTSYAEKTLYLLKAKP